MQPVKGNLLVVDDNRDDLRLLATILTERGYEVRPALNGMAALAAVRVTPPDLIILDIQMPDLDGYATCRQLKADQQTRDIPVIFISARHEVFDKVTAFTAGSVDYISKPFQAEEVIARIEIQLRLYHMQQNLEMKNRLLQMEIAERKKIEADFYHQQNHLEELVEERTAELQQANTLLQLEIAERKRAESFVQAQAEALSKSNAELARVLRLKDEFLAMMSHELRTPLTVVLGITEAMVEEEVYGSISAEQREALSRVVQSGRHLLAIVADILDLTSIEAGAATLEWEVVDAEVICLAAIQFILDTARQKRIRLLRSVEYGFAGLYADKRRLTQILVNLLDNAVKFTPEGGSIGLEVSTDAAQERIIFVVWDTGIGIDQEDYHRLFQPFTQVDGRLSRRYGGIGLGLTLVRRLVELHGGSISLTSTLGQGSRFTVSLPWVSGDHGALLADQVSSPPSWAQSLRVVLADDDENTLQRYAELLFQLGCQVILARTGSEVLTQVGTIQPDLVVLDIQMPGMDGLMVIRNIRADPALRQVQIIALTALTMPGDREHCLNTGASAYLTKPVSLRTLVATIAEVLLTRNA